MKTGLEAIKVDGVQFGVLYVTVCDRDLLMKVEGKLERESGSYMVCVQLWWGSRA